MKKKFFLLLFSTIILYLCLSFLFVSKIEAQYLPFYASLAFQNILYNQQISLPYLGNNILNPLDSINNYNQNIPYITWINPSPGSLWSLIFPDLNQIRTQQSQNLYPLGQSIYQANSDFYSPYNSSIQSGFIQAPNTYSTFATPFTFFSQAGSISPFSTQPFPTFNSLSYSPQLTTILPSPLTQGYYTYLNSSQGQLVQNFYRNDTLYGGSLSLPYLPNNNYYIPGTNGSGTDDIRITSLLSPELVLANPEYGMYCWDPIKWINGDYHVGIWCYRIPIRAQSLDKRGRLFNETPGFTVEPTGESGLMELIDSSISLYRGYITAKGPNEYLVTVVVDSASTVAVANRRHASCDACHPVPPGHIGVEMTWGNCHECHNLGDKMHRHAYKAYIPIDKCYTCHPTGCLSGSHGQRGIWCTPCHGTLEDAAFGRMKISGQLGKPLCGDCHDPLHSEPGGELFVKSSGHGGIWCINCHGATHVELSQPVGLNNCTFCHTVQANIKWMGPNCALCHGSSFSPHFVANL